MTTTPEMRHDRLTHSAPFDRMKRMRAQVGRDKLVMAMELEDGNWHLVCRDCKDSIAPLTGPPLTGRTYTLSELLSTAVAHHVQKHAIDLTYEHYGEDYA